MKVFQERIRNLASGLLILLGISIPISVVADNILLGLVLLVWVLGGNFRQKIRMMWYHPVARAGLLLFVFLVLGAFYGRAGAAASASMLFKLKGFVLIGILSGLIPKDAATRTRMLNGFLWAMGLTLALSYLVAFHLVNAQAFHLNGSAQDASIFKDHITQSFLLSYAALIWAGRARLAQGKWRLLWIMMVLLSAYCIVFLLQGRTGYMTLALLVLYAGFHFSRARMKGVAAGVALLILASFAAFHYSRPFEQRIQIAETQALNWQNNRPVGESDSIGLRLEFYTNSFRVWLKHPVWGVGTGGFAQAYRHQVKGTGEIATDNPHNDMLLIVVQIGLIGALALFYLYFCAWQAAAALPPLYQYLARGLVILYVSGGLVDAVLFSHTESMAFAWLVALVYAGLPALQDKTCV